MAAAGIDASLLVPGDNGAAACDSVGGATEADDDGDAGVDGADGIDSDGSRTKIGEGRIASGNGTTADVGTAGATYEGMATGSDDGGMMLESRTTSNVRRFFFFRSIVVVVVALVETGFEFGFAASMMLIVDAVGCARPLSASLLMPLTMIDASLVVAIVPMTMIPIMIVIIDIIVNDFVIIDDVGIGDLAPLIEQRISTVAVAVAL